MFPRLMDEALKLRLTTHAMVETVIILLLPRIAARTCNTTWSALNAELATYNITLIGPGERNNSHMYSLDPYYEAKVEEKERATRNENRKRKRDQMLEGIKKKITAHPPVQRNDDLFGVNGARYDYQDAIPHGSEVLTSEEQDAVSAWAGVSEEDIQVFVDDRIRLVVYGSSDVDFQITAFRFVLGEPIEI